VNSLLTESATTLAGRIRRGEVSSEEVVRAHVERARQTHERLRAVVCDRYEAALAEARACDARAARGEVLPPLHGVPCSIKECFALTGMPQSVRPTTRPPSRGSGPLARSRSV
jgi:fatty acid amide hydrolase 2